MSKEKVMILTDDDGSKNNLIKKLGQWNYNTYSFPKTSSLLSESDGIKPDLIIMDLNPNSEIDEVKVGVDAIKKYNVPLIYLSSDINGRISGSNIY